MNQFMLKYKFLVQLDTKFVHLSFVNIELDTNFVVNLSFVNIIRILKMYAVF